jgi:hypothetical protein
VKGLGKIEVGWAVGLAAVEKTGWDAGDRRGLVQGFAVRKSVMCGLMEGWDLQG